MATGGSTRLVTTKLSAPTLPGRLVSRSRLDAILDRAVADPHVRLVLVSAPAGSGKSTLVAGWQQKQADSAWLQIDPADRDGARFWAHVVAAIEQTVAIGDDVRNSIARAAEDPGPLIDAIANTFANAVGSAPSISLVIDDYHLATSPAIDEALERLIELAPDNVTVVLVTRWDPSLRLSRLRVAGRLAEVRAADLRFLDDEAADLLGYGTDSPGDVRDRVRVLCERTEGWAAGLVLARLSLASTDDQAGFVEAFRGDDRLIVDYLSDELFSQTNADELERLLATSILHEMSGPLVDAVCDTSDGARWLDDLAARNQLVIGLDRSSEWYRYHHLLRDVLQAKAAATAPIHEFHRRAGHWHQDHGDLDRAIEHLLAAEDVDDAADAIAERSMTLLNLGQVETVSRYIDRLGPAADAHLRCASFAGWIHAMYGRIGDAEESLERMRALEATAPDDPFASGLIGGLDVLLRLGHGDVGGAISAASTSPVIDDGTQTAVLAEAFAWGGRFDDAESLLQRSADLGKRFGDLFALTGAPAFRSVVALERDDRDLAHRQAADTIVVIEEMKAPDGGHGALAHAVLARTSSDADEAVSEARRAAELASVIVFPLTQAYVLASAGDVLCAHGELDGADLVRRSRSLIARTADPGIVGRYLARVEARHQLGTAAPAPGPTGLIEELTDREVAVLRYLPSPMSQRDIANELYVSLNTVKTHCKAIYRKLAVGDRKAAVQAARDAGLL